MTQFLIYDLKVAALLAVLYAFYKLLLERETLHRVSRVVLLLTAMLSLVLPLCVITLHKEVVVEIDEKFSNTHFTNSNMLAEAQGINADMLTGWALWEPIITAIMIVGCIFCITKTVIGLRRIHSLIKNSEKHELEDGIRVAVTDVHVTPFSWMNTVVVGRDDYPKDASSDGDVWQIILAHERGHIRNRHSQDVIFMEMLTALQWFNPVVWLLKQDLRAIHEYEADANVLSQGFCPSLYIDLLMRKATGVQACTLANGIGNSLIKKRVKMMIMKKSSKFKALKALYIVPIVATSLALTAKTIVDYKYVRTPSADLSVEEKVIDDDLTIGHNGQRRIPVYGERQEIKAEEMYVIIDGKPSTVEELRALNRENIEYMEVLKEESGRKLYGEKGANGVLIIHTFKNKPADDDPVYEICEELPSYEGGNEKLMEFLARSVKYPEIAQENGVQGRVIVTFIVEKDGSVSNPKVLSVGGKSINELNEVTVTAYKTEMTDAERASVDNQNAAYKAMADEALRVITIMPKWKPGKQSGQPVRVRFTLPLTFRLS